MSFDKHKYKYYSVPHNKIVKINIIKKLKKVNLRKFILKIKVNLYFIQ